MRYISGNKDFEKHYPFRLEGIVSIVDKISTFVDGRLVLEIGCGPGIVANLYPHSTKVTGLDFAFSMLKRAKTRVYQLVRGSALNLPFQHESFEVVTCFFVASDYAVKDDFFAEAHRVLETNELFLFADYSPNDEHFILRRRIRSLQGKTYNIFIENEEDLSRKIGHAKFEVERIERITFEPEFELEWYVKSDEELEQLKETDQSLWRFIQRRMNCKKMKRELILVFSKKCLTGQ